MMHYCFHVSKNERQLLQSALSCRQSSPKGKIRPLLFGEVTRMFSACWCATSFLRMTFQWSPVASSDILLLNGSMTMTCEGVQKVAPVVQTGFYM